MTDNPSLLSHVSVGVADVGRAATFYDAVLAPLGARRILEEGGHAIAYGRQFPEFWVQRPHDGGAPVPGNGAHFSFLARSRAEVNAFHAAGLTAGGQCDGPPGTRPHSGPEYYGAFLRDPDGNKIEAMVWQAAG